MKKNIEIHDLLYKRSDKPFGKTWEEWAVEWWRFALSIPKSQNPGFDKDGKNFDININPYENVIFLIATYGGNAERYHTIPSDKAIFGPIMNYEMNFLEKPQIKSEKELVNHVIKDVDDFKNKHFSINGMEFNVDNFRVDSDLFDITLIDNNIFCVPPGKTKAVCSGYYFFLKPLVKGLYDINVGGSCSTGITSVDVIWHLNVV